MKKLFFLFAVLFSVAVCGVANAGKESLPGILALLLGGSSHFSGPPLAHQAAMVGPLSGAVVKAYRVNKPDSPVEGPKNAVTDTSNLEAAGTFQLSLTGVADSEWVVVAAFSGKDIDANGDGIADPAPTQSLGTLHTLASAQDWRGKHLRVTPLTEIAWRYVENLAPEIAQDELNIRLGDLARALIKSDISGNGTIDYDDILAFDPANPAHRAKLAINYGWLTTANDAGQTILASLLAGDTNACLAQLDETFSYLMTRFPAPDSRYHSIKLSLSVFGPGHAASGAPYNLLVDSTLATPVYERSTFLIAVDTSVTFTATPITGSHILSWSGCETVSADLSQCTVPLNKSQSVVANFGRTATTLKGVLHDLSRAGNTLGVNTIAVVIPDDMADLIADMDSAAIGDFIVGDDGGGFLRRITGITKTNTTHYQLATVEANLDEVIAQGTGHLFKQMENGDLDGYVAPVAGQTATVSPQAFTGLAGAQLTASKNPTDHTFTITLGAPASSTSALQATSGSTTATVTLYDDGHGGTLSASGEINMDISLDTGFDYAWTGGLQAFKFITILDAEQSINLTASAELAKFNFVKKKIGTLRFAPIVFSVGPVPVWVTPTVDIFLFADGKVEMEASFGTTFQQRVEGGLLYNKDTGFAIHKSFTSDRSYILSGAVSASVKGGMEASPALKIYDATGPALPSETYVKLKSSVGAEAIGSCVDVNVELLLGTAVSFMWDMSGSTKLGEMLHLDQLEEKTRFEIASLEWTMKKWTPYNSCAIPGSFLVVKGNSISSTIDAGDTSGLATTLTVSNTGSETLHWATSNVPSAVTISPSSGDLGPGAQEVVQMSVATGGLPVGRYLKKPFFYNKASDGTNLPDTQFGNTYKTIDITVQAPINDTPSLTSATSANVGQVTLNWSFTASGSDPFVGFQIFATRTPAVPASYQLVSTTNIYARQAVISGLIPGSTYSLDLRAYSNNGASPGPFSNARSVLVLGNPPVATGTLPDTGQTGDYTATFGEDSDYTINPPSYTDNHNGTVTDNVTGLMWQQANAGGTATYTATYNWYQAAGVYDAASNPSTQDVCGAQTTGGYSDWRLPSKKELVGIVDYGRYDPSINPIFTGVQASWYWSSSTYASNVYYAWGVYFDNGDVGYNNRSDTNYVRCVRGGQ